MISIVFDSENFISGSFDVLVSSCSEYVIAYKIIVESIEKSRRIKVKVNNATSFRWFQRMASRYPQGVFTFETMDARQALAQTWDVDVPEEVSNEDILQTGLLDLGIQPEPGMPFEDILLKHFYAPIFTAKTFPFSQLTALFQAVDPERWRENKRHPLLARVYHQRIEEWKNKARTSEQRQFIEWFAEDPTVLKRRLMEYHVLRAYPHIGRKLMRETFDLLKLLQLPLEGFEVREEQIQDAVRQITYFLNSQNPNTADDLAVLVDSLGGLLMVEFETVEKILDAHPDWISHSLLDKVEEKFAPLQKRVRQRIHALRRKIRPPKPSYPSPDWDVEQMLQWATESYLPYQEWCDAQEQFDPELYQIGDQFSEWLIQHWNDLRANSKRMVFNILPNIAADLADPEQFHLILVVDNLGWSLSSTLIDLFQERGFYRTSARAYLSMAPSETEISKKCLLSGGVGYLAIDDTTYKGIIERGWLPYNSQQFRYLSNIGSLSSIDSLDASVYVVNYLAVDNALHESSENIGMSHREHIQHLLEKLVENCVQFIEKHHLEGKIRIHVVSDHGSTRIPEQIPNDLTPSMFKASGFDIRSHRHVVVSPERFASLAENLQYDCFFLPQNDFLNPGHILCARRGNRFLPTTQNAYVHGGLLPEEMIVPHLVFESVTAPVKNLDLILGKREYRYRSETVEVELGNPNDVMVERISVMIMNGNVESAPVQIPVIQPHSQSAVKIQARFRQTSVAEDRNSLRFHIRFNARGEQHSFDWEADISMRQMVEEKSQDLFED